MDEKLPATPPWLRQRDQWNPSVGFRCERGGPYVDTCLRFTPCIGVLNQGDSLLLSNRGMAEVVVYADMKREGTAMSRANVESGQHNLTPEICHV